MYKIEFDEERHLYYVDGKLTPSVSQIIRNVLKNDEPIPDYAKPAMERGTYIHKVIHKALTSNLDESSIDKSVIGYFDSWKLWYKECGLKMELSEKILYEPEGDYCLTIDYVGKDSAGGRHLLDWKTGQIYSTYGPQLGGYEVGYIANYLSPVKIACIQLFKNGIIAKTHYYDDFECMEDWNAINRVYKLRKKKIL